MTGQIASIVASVFGIVLVGWLYARHHGPDMSAANRVNLEVFTTALIFHVLPPAVLSYVLAEQYHQEPEAVAAIVIWGNLAALVTIPLTLAVVLR